MAGVGEGFEGVRALRPASLLRRRAGLFRMGIEPELDDNSGFDDVYEIKWKMNSDEPFFVQERGVSID